LTILRDLKKLTAMLDRFFRLSENRTTVRTEILAGVTTFLTMAYIIMVQPAVLSGKMFGPDKLTGMDFNAVMAATCLSAALATLIMALYARYPIAQAPGMGENFFFVFAAMPAAAAAGYTNSWQVALGVVFISGVLFLLLTFVGIRERIMDSISPDLKHAIAAGIGLFIAFIGLQNATLIVKDPGTMVKLHPAFFSPDLIVFFFGLFLTAILHARGISGSILWGIAGSTALAIVLRLVMPCLPVAIAGSPAVTGSLLMTRFQIAHAIVAAPPSLAPTFLKMDVVHALSAPMLPFIMIFLFMLVFDTIGTLIGVCGQAGLIQNNKLPRAKQALVSDAVATVVGAGLGTSTVTSFIESAAGVQQGGRTGLTGVVVAILFLLALFFSPVVGMVGSYAPITAPALVIVGSMMMSDVSRINWSDYSESIPAFLTILGMPLCFSIGDGLALGFISHPIIKLFSGKGRQVNALMYVLAVILILYFALVRSQKG
jgi:AGZA family xanthine/uracil permease-like MFS transporter